MGQVARRTFLSRLGVVLGATPWACFAQANRLRRIGVVDNTIPLADLTGKVPADPNARVLVEALAELGWVVGKNIEIVWRSAEEQYERRPQLLEELVRMPVDVILVYGNESIKLAMQATRTIPIVMVSSQNVVRQKLVASHGRPGGNVTGLDSSPDVTIGGKRLTLLKEAVPGLKTVAFFRAPYNETEPLLPETLEAGRRLGLTMIRVTVDGPAALEAAFSSAVRQGRTAWRWAAKAS
jgi:putative ABC transport system substrate-binding protein